MVDGTPRHGSGPRHASPTVQGPAGWTWPLPRTQPAALPPEAVSDKEEEETQQGFSGSIPHHNPVNPGLCPPGPSVNLALRELLFDGLFSGLAVREVKAEVGPLVRSRAPAWAPAVGDGDGVAHAEVHSLHDPLPLELPGAADGDGGGVAAGADQLLGPVVVALLQVLQAPPDGHPVLVRDLQGAEVLQEPRGGPPLKALPRGPRSPPSCDLAVKPAAKAVVLGTGELRRGMCV